MKATGYPDVDPWVVEWFEQYGVFMDQPAELTPETLAPTRPSQPHPPEPSPGIASVTEADADGVPVWIYHPAEPAGGVVVYFHGGGFIGGSRLLMDVIARNLAVCSGAVVVSVEYRLAPENPYPAGLDDCETATRWVIANAAQFGAAPSQIVIGGESAGGNLSAALSLRLRDRGGPQLAGQLLMYPATDVSTARWPSRDVYDGLVLGYADFDRLVPTYMGNDDPVTDPYVSVLHAPDLGNLPPAYVMVGGCDWLRDEGLAYAQRLHGAGVATETQTCPGQPHGFLNLAFPASDSFYAAVGPWLRERLR